jgi:restriction system protein
MSRSFRIERDGYPDLPSMMLATIEALKTLGGSAGLHELDEQVIESEGITEEEQSILMPDGNSTKLKYYLRWARTYLKRGNALNNSKRGVWGLTSKGEDLSTLDETRAIYDQVTLEERERAKAKREARDSSNVPIDEQLNTDGTNESDDELLADGDKSENWKAELLKIVKVMDPAAFERLSQRLLREAGFSKVEVRGKSGDGGIDGVGVLRVNLVSFQIYFQCKRYKGSVGSKEIRDFRGASVGRADKGLFITTGTFTTQAADEAIRDGAPAIDLIDGDRLCDLLKEFGLGVGTELIEQVNIDSEWFSSV